MARHHHDSEIDIYKYAFVQTLEERAGYEQLTGKEKEELFSYWKNNINT